MNMERFQGTLMRFAEHLRNRGEETAAKAVETIAKYVNRHTNSPEGGCFDCCDHDASGLLEED